MTKTKKTLARLLSFSLAAGVAAMATTSAHAQPRAGEKIRGAFPVLDVGVPQAGGQAAVDRLGARLQDVAAWYGKSPDMLRKELLSDRRMRVDKAGRLLAVEDMEAPVVATADTQSAVLDGALVSLDQTFALHSRPGASRTIYLDFDGATIANTVWNSNSNIITAKPFDIDGNPASFSATELQRIQYIWQRVAEDYSPFDVDITTEPPPADRLTRTDTSDQTFGTTVVITDNTGVYSCSCGGVAYVGVYNYAATDYYKPAFVFYNMLGSGAEKPVAEAISHEVGHNVGLHHDGTSSTSYYGGQGSDAVTGWAPIMGVGYYKPLVQFSKGEYAGANNLEDDFAVAQSFGLPLRGDDYGNTTAAARALQPAVSGALASASIDGVIEQSGDRDVFSIASGPGTLNVSVAPASRSPNADLVLSLIDSRGQVLASQNPLNALGASLSFAIPAQGTYYLEARGTGQGDPATTGYSSYGSAGSFRLAASYPVASGAAPTAVITANVTSGTGPLSVTFNGAQSTDDGRVAFWYWDFGDGTGDQTGSLSSVTHVYQAAGSYVARLTVVDDSGLSATSSMPITVKLADVKITNVGVKKSRRGAAASASVDVTGPDGQVVRGAVVQVSWSGAVSKQATRKSARSGRASFVSPATPAGGCITLTVTSVTAPGHVFDPSSLPTTQLCL